MQNGQSEPPLGLFAARAIPEFFLYGEPYRGVAERFIHVEPLAKRGLPNHWQIQPHTHRDLHHLFLFLSGGGHARADDACHVLRPPMMALVPAGVVHAFTFQLATHGYVVTTCDALLRVILAREQAFEGLFAVSRWLELSREDILTDDIRETVEGLHREVGNGAPAQLAAAEARLQLLLASAARLLATDRGAGGVRPAVPRATALVETFRSLVEEHFRYNWQLADYARAMHVSSAHLRAMCVRVAGVSPMQLIHECALRAAKRDLLYTNSPVSAIASSLGFDDPGYFSRFFQKRCGISPSQFRMRARQTPVQAD
jgi:AraC family transcriptional regulator, transcriptional activator of pobA